MTPNAADLHALLESRHPAFRASAEAALKEAAEDDAIESVTEGDYWNDLPPVIREGMKLLMQAVNENWHSGDAGLGEIAANARAVFRQAVAEEANRILEEG